MFIGRDKKAFSLIELVIVIIILGIIAAIAIPRIGAANASAAESAVRANLASLRNAIDQYYIEHKNTYPTDKGDGDNNRKTEEAFINQLTMYTNANGEYSEDKDPAFPHGPYLRSGIPKQTVGQFAGKTTVRIFEQDTPLATNSGGQPGWCYNITTGQIIANSDDLGSDGIAYCDW